MPEDLLRPEEVAMALTDQAAVNNFVEFAEMMVEPNDIPVRIQTPFWGFLSRETTLSRSDNRDRMRAENRFCIARNLYLMDIPQHKVNVSLLMDFSNAQNRTTIRTNRSVGGFERQALTTQIKQIITNRDEARQDRGVWTGIKKKLGLGPKDDQPMGVAK